MAADSFEGTISAHLSRGRRSDLDEDPNFYAKSENYTGSSVHTLNTLIQARHKREHTLCAVNQQDQCKISPLVEKFKNRLFNDVTDGVENPTVTSSLKIVRSQTWQADSQSVTSRERDEWAINGDIQRPRTEGTVERAKAAIDRFEQNFDQFSVKHEPKNVSTVYIYSFKCRILPSKRLM